MDPRKLKLHTVGVTIRAARFTLGSIIFCACTKHGLFASQNTQECLTVFTVVILATKKRCFLGGKNLSLKYYTKS
jgi:hypothetical protein